MSVEQYTSNDWLIPVGEKTLAVLSPYPKDKAIKIVSIAVFEEICSERTIPWTMVFDNESLSDVIGRLEETLKNPDGVGIQNDVELRSGVNDLKRILWEAGADTGMLAAHAVWHMFGVVEGDQRRAFIYQDLARRYPQYADKWITQLRKQFGEGNVQQAASRHPGFLTLMDESEKIAQLYSPNSLQKPNESVSQFLNRAFSSAAQVGLDELSRMLDSRLIPYQKAAYALRGLELPSVSA